MADKAVRWRNDADEAWRKQAVFDFTEGAHEAFSEVAGYGRGDDAEHRQRERDKHHARLQRLSDERRGEQAEYEHHGSAIHGRHRHDKLPASRHQYRWRDGADEPGSRDGGDAGEYRVRRGWGCYGGTVGCYRCVSSAGVEPVRPRVCVDGADEPWFGWRC